MCRSTVTVILDRIAMFMVDCINRDKWFNSHNGASDTTMWSSAPSGNIQGICPSGWVLPTDQDWCNLATYVDSTVNCSTLGSTGTDAGGELKESGFSHWSKPNSGAKDYYHFTGLPSGSRDTSKTFSSLSYQTGFWTMSESTAKKAIDWGLGYDTATIIRSNTNKATGLSIRCFQICTPPTRTTGSTNISFPNQIIWYCNSVSGATGYRWGKINNYDSSLDLGSSTSYTETGLTCNTSYNSYIWVYNNCNHSGSTTLSQTTSLDPPGTPIAGKNIPSLTQIIWKWKKVQGATGYLWNTTNNDTTAIDMGTDTSYTETGLNTSTIYTRYVWAYNGNCGNSFPRMLTQTTSTFVCDSTFTDSRNNQVYTTQLYGNQCWMTKNLNIGTKISSSQDQTWNASDSIFKYCYNDDTSKCTTYGGYYQWGEIVQFKGGASDTSFGITPPTDTTRGICPKGWYIPDHDAWCTLLIDLDDSVNCNIDGFTGHDIGIIARLPNGTGNANWLTSLYQGNNASFFAAIGAGILDYYREWYLMWEEEHFWSLSQYYPYDPRSAADVSFTYWSTQVNINPSTPKNQAFSVRCFKDCGSTPSAPSPGTNISHPSWIIWEWDTVPSAVGYAWSSTNNYDSAIDVGTNTYYSQMSLKCDTAYTSYVWAYSECTHSLVTTLHDSTLACPPPCGSAFADPRDGTIYNTTLIGNQCWMATNLNYGMMIHGDSNQLVAEKKYCYHDSINNCNIYGGLYQWGEAMNFQWGVSDSTLWNPVPIDFVQGACPPGWHIPSLEEFTLLADSLNGWWNAGYHMKEILYYQHWLPPDPADNLSLFTALGAGIVSGHQFSQIKYASYYWTTTEPNFHQAWDPDLQDSWYMLSLSGCNEKSDGFSVRCIRNY